MKTGGQNAKRRYGYYRFVDARYRNSLRGTVRAQRGLAMTDETIKALIEYDLVEDTSGEFHIVVMVDRQIRDRVGPFETRAECERAYEDLLDMMRSQGAIDIPGTMQ